MKNLIIRRFCLLTFSVILVFPVPVFAEDIRIALRANKGEQKGLDKWQATADYLSEKIPGYKFIMVPFENNSELNQAVSRNEFHFCLTNPASAVEHKLLYGAQPLATLVNKRQGKGFSKFGSVIFTRQDRNDINNFNDLKGKIFLAVDELGFGGWRVAWKELLENKINPYKDFQEVRFAGGKQQKVVYAVRDEKADAGSVRSDMLERMAEAGKINLDDFKVIGKKKTGDFPFLHSTELYPEWLFSATKKMDADFKTKVYTALLSIPDDSQAAIKGKYIGWIKPLDYAPVEQLLKKLAVGPYHVAKIGTVRWIINQYGQQIILSFVVFVLLSLLLMFYMRQNKLIHDAKEKLVKEIEARENLELQLVHSQKIESLGQLTGGIAHDFNNMLASMLGFTELALSSDSVRKDTKLTRYLNQVIASGESAKILVGQMLAYSRAGEKVNKTEIVSVSEVIKNSYELLRPLLPTSIDLIVNKGSQVLYVNIDKVMMEQVLMNLCLNAKDAMSSNKGKITISSEIVEYKKTLCSSCFQDISGAYVAIQIDDNGSGIEAEVINRLFEPYYSTKEVGKGTGMGLSMVHSIVHKHLGHIKLDSKPGKGTSIKILLPQEFQQDKSSQPSEKEVSPEVVQVKPTGLENKHILVVDDESYITKYISELLQMKGYQVTAMNNSLEAFSFFEKHFDELDLVIADQTMPSLTGCEMAAKMLSISSGFPIILCTGYSEDVDKNKALELKISTFLEKPVKSTDLLNAINNLLS